MNSIQIGRRVIGVCGLNASGKSTVCSFYKEKGYQVVSLSDVIRKVVRERGIPETRQCLIDTGNELRNKHGAGILAKMIVETLKTDINYVIDSIRHPDEVRELRSGIPMFCLVGIECSLETRYSRLLSRARPGDQQISFDKFKEIDQQELNNPDPLGQQISDVLKMTNYSIDNNTSDYQTFQSNVTNKLSSDIDHFFKNIQQQQT